MVVEGVDGFLVVFVYCELFIVVWVDVDVDRVEVVVFLVVCRG